MSSEGVLRSEVLEGLDREIAIALQVNGRASWRAIARSLGVPERTVTRRGQSMLDSGLVKVSVYLDTTRVGEARPLIVVAETEPGTSFRIGQEIAKRSDASSVSVLEGTGRLVCMILPASATTRYELLHHDLASLEGLRGTSVSTVLRYFRAGYDWYAGTLSQDVRDGLDLLPTSDPERTDIVQLTREDELLTAQLTRDGRSPISKLAEVAGMNPKSVQRHLLRLFEEGAIHIRTEIRPQLLGLNVEVLVWLRVPPTEIDAVGRSLSASTSVRFCAATTGHTQILLDCLFPSENGVYEFLTNDLGMLGTIGIENVAVVVAALRRGPLVMTWPA